jgi:hypothetical protein
MSARITSTAVKGIGKQGKIRKDLENKGSKAPFRTG